ncbi:hypothetical protein PSHT_11286 [Puccinia striiformis]|uniref:Retrotransposon Copia-like N-terminal domain-containing protein n=1 Tax=Puccinia striiformis TaxID=27350 RepID=A0A2S4V4F8_9BASI|nr:hypothetical protein PSHT_11286 [Puccinia striiformis]
MNDPSISLYPAKDQTVAPTDIGSTGSDNVYLGNAINGIPLLTMDNYLLWRKQLIQMLNLQGLTGSLMKPDGVLTPKQNNELVSVITTKLEGKVEINITDEDNENNARKLWKSISEFFASKQRANKARIHQEMRAIVFDIHDVQKFITEVKTVLSRMREVGIDTSDNVCYNILGKFPEALSNISSRITHSDKPLTNQLILEHLKQFANNQKTLW